MPRRLSALVFCFSCLGSIHTNAADPTTATFAGVPRAEIDATLQLAYNLDPVAPAAMQAMIQAYPESPVGYLLDEMWWMARVDYWSGPNENLNDTFDDAYDRARDVAKDYYKDHHDDPEARLLLGMVEVGAARYYIAREKWLSAAFKARAGLSHLKKVLKLDPTNTDAPMMLGVANCYLADAPAYLKPLVFLMRFSGDQAEGLAQLQTAANDGFLTRYEARFYLALIYWELREDYPKSGATYAEFATLFPHNVEVLRMRSKVAAKLGDEGQVIDLLSQLFALPQRTMLGPRLGWTSLRQAQAAHELHQPELALSCARRTRALEAPYLDLDDRPAIEAWTWFYEGSALRLLGRDAEARAAFEQITAKDQADAYAQAQNELTTLPR